MAKLALVCGPSSLPRAHGSRFGGVQARNWVTSPGQLRSRFLRNHTWLHINHWALEGVGSLKGVPAFHPQEWSAERGRHRPGQEGASRVGGHRMASSGSVSSARSPGPLRPAGALPLNSAQRTGEAGWGQKGAGTALWSQSMLGQKAELFRVEGPWVT